MVAATPRITSTIIISSTLKPFVALIFTASPNITLKPFALTPQIVCQV
jgi:hypothetical protein